MRPPAHVIAEIGCNHKGNFDTAIQLINAAKDAGADVAKFQKRNVKESLREEIYNGPHPNPHNSYGNTYGEHREALELTNEEHVKLKNYCDKIGIEYCCTPFDITSAEFIISLKMKNIKIASFHNNHPELIRYICDHHEGIIHISLGMITDKELKI